MDATTGPGLVVARTSCSVTEHWLCENLFQLHEDFRDGHGRVALHYHYLIINDIIA